MSHSRASKNNFELEGLEPRLLLSADGLLGAAADRLGESSEPLDAIWVENDSQFLRAENAVEGADNGIFEVEDEAISVGGESDVDAADDLHDTAGSPYNSTSQSDILPTAPSLGETLSLLAKQSSVAEMSLGETSQDYLAHQQLENTVQPRAPPIPGLDAVSSPSNSIGATELQSDSGSSWLPIHEVASLLKPVVVTGATIITHGFQIGFEGTMDLILKANPDVTPTVRAALEKVAKASGDALSDLADAIFNKVKDHNKDKGEDKEHAWILDYDI